MSDLGRMNGINRRLLSRLYQDLAELQANPYPGVSIFTDDANIRKICLVIIPPSGPWTGLPLHFDVILPYNWPMAPPRVASSVAGIKHPNLFGTFICCDLLNPTEANQKGYAGGYSPALTLRGLFLQFLTFFSSTKIEQEHGGYIDIGDQTFVCYAFDSEVDRYRAPLYQDSYRPTPSHEKILKSLWESDITDEVLVRQQGNATDSTKTLIFRNAAAPVHKIEWINIRRTATYESISTWTCSKCPYGGPQHQAVLTTPNTTIHTPATLLRPPPICSLDTLNDDVSGEIASFLPSESIISSSMTYQRFRHVVTSMHLVLRQELRCFFLRTPLNESILGVGVRFDPGSRKLSSDFDWLSLEAFEDFESTACDMDSRCNHRSSSLRQEDINAAQKTRQPMNRRAGPPEHDHQRVEVLYRMMNNIVVSLMKSCDDTMGQNAGEHEVHTRTLLYASEKAIISYCHLFHLLIRLCETTPAILQSATRKLQQFIDRPDTRLKEHTPDMGELIVLITLVLALPPIANPLSLGMIFAASFFKRPLRATFVGL